MPRHASPKIYKIVLYNEVIILDDNGNRTDENRPSKKDPRKRKNRMNDEFPKPFVRKKKKFKSNTNSNINIENEFDIQTKSFLTDKEVVLKLEQNINDEYFKNLTNFDDDFDLADDDFSDPLLDFADKK
ncbi:hypothetical protein M9Y10_033361 [Tritrichomonas musculus]|uniref:Uncharacterized protein n=1 Tax=Tritrichomonas musculus TaxID=1915356 RepID=A0ABR2KBX0_9EUKA